MNLKKDWWKFLGAGLVFYTIVSGFLMPVPRREILNETIRNLYFHVPMWFSLTVMCLIAFIFSIMYLNTKNAKYDAYALAFSESGFIFGLAGMATGMLWAKYTWGSAWSQDIKQITSAILLFMYSAYLILRNSIDDQDKRATIAAVYNIFAFVMIYPLMFKIPRMVDSLHPGNGGNPALGDDSLANMMKPIFYPAVIAWILMAVWIATLRYRAYRLETQATDTTQLHLEN